MYTHTQKYYNLTKSEIKKYILVKYVVSYTSPCSNSNEDRTGLFSQRRDNNNLMLPT